MMLAKIVRKKMSHTNVFRQSRCLKLAIPTKNCPKVVSNPNKNKNKKKMNLKLKNQNRDNDSGIFFINSRAWPAGGSSHHSHEETHRRATLPVSCRVKNENKLINFSHPKTVYNVHFSCTHITYRYSIWWYFNVFFTAVFRILTKIHYKIKVNSKFFWNRNKIIKKLIPNVF